MNKMNDINKIEQTIFYRDAYKQKQKLSMIGLNTKKMLSSEFKLNSYKFGMEQEMETIDLVEGSLNCGLNSSISYRNLLFIKVTEKLWTVHHKDENGEMRHFETIDFTTYIEHDLFEHLIEEMRKGPESYWEVDSFREIPKNYADQLVEDFLNGHIQAKTFGDAFDERFKAKCNAEKYEPEMGWYVANELRKTRNELKLYEESWYGTDEDVFCDTFANDIVELEDTLKFCSKPGAGLGQSISYRNLMFVSSSTSVWCVCHINNEEEVTHFETIDFSPYIEHGLFVDLIEGMVKGPEYYWAVSKFTTMPKNKAQQILGDFLDGTITPSEALMEYEWVQLMTGRNLRKKEVKITEISPEELPF